MKRTQSSLKIAFLGAGWIVSRVWNPLLRELGAEVAVVVDPCISKVEVAEVFGPQVSLFTDSESASLADCDLAIVCSPNCYHIDHAVLALEQGLDVILDKPACLDQDNADRLIQAASRSGRLFWVTAASSARDDVVAIRNLIGEGRVGAVQCVDISWRRAAGVPRPGSWFTSKEMALGGSSVDLGWHLLEVALGLVDYPQVVGGVSHKVVPPMVSIDQGAAWRHDLQNVSTSVPMNVDTQLYAALKCHGGQLIRVSTAWTAHSGGDSTRISVFGSDGEISLDTLFGFSKNRDEEEGLVLRTKGAKEVIPVSMPEKMLPYRKFLEHVFLSLGNESKRLSSQAREIAKLRSIVSAYAFI